MTTSAIDAGDGRKLSAPFHWRRQLPGLSVLVPVGLIGCCVGYPFVLIVTSALNVGDPNSIVVTKYGLANFQNLLDHIDWIANSLFVSILGTAICLFIGVVIAWTLHRTTVPGTRLFETLVAIPFPLGALVAALAWNVLGSPTGGLINEVYRAVSGSSGSLVNTWHPIGIAFVMALFEAPIPILIVGAAMMRMDASLEECSAIHGASRLRTIFRITLPLMAPAIANAGVFILISMLGNFAIPTILGAGSRFIVLTTAIFNAISAYPTDYPMVGVFGLVLVAVTALAVWLNKLLLGARSYVVVSGKNYRPRRLDMGLATWPLFAFLCLYVFLAVVLPLVALIISSLQLTTAIDWTSGWTLDNYRQVFDYPPMRGAVMNTLILGASLGVFGAGIVTAIAWVVHRTQGPGRRVLHGFAILPQAFPRFVFGVGILWMVVLLPINIYGTLFAVFLAYLIIFLPLGYLSISGVMVQLDRSLEEAARVSGAGWLRSMRTVTFPLLSGGIVATGSLMFMMSIQEVSTSMFLSGPRTPVLGPVIIGFWLSGGAPVVSALAVVQAVIVLVLMVAARWATAVLSRDAQN